MQQQNAGCLAAPASVCTGSLLGTSSMVAMQGYTGRRCGAGQHQACGAPDNWRRRSRTGVHHTYLLEQVPDAGGTHSYKHFHELGPTDAEEGHSSLACNGLGQQGLSGARGPHQEHTLGDAGAHRCKPLGALQELNHLEHVT